MIGQTNTSIFSFSTHFNIGVGSTNNLEGSFKGDMWLRVTKNVDAYSNGRLGFNGTHTTIVKAGDSAEDNTVDIGDYAVFSAAYGSVPTDANWNKLADYNGDDVVNSLDYIIFQQNFGKTGDNW